MKQKKPPRPLREEEFRPNPKCTCKEWPGPKPSFTENNGETWEKYFQWSLRQRAKCAYQRFEIVPFPGFADGGVVPREIEAKIREQGPEALTYVERYSMYDPRSVRAWLREWHRSDGTIPK